ncbi:S9 family peptidase [Saccharothrix australiensis]|uniref:Dipeptidyl aminopeptidase/acylaminoacyl peptidase n=1 Tax=Saccharothrix australiensis TaxID=2072 RepID=A0A495VZN5_9PSEU|nr:prolyl oligopeptidase family serine peptidase [Saccharothrix australiensis]RKT54217.1 dipeptidyl aminopeptidase/acylaminoacyl peptidase [Saccharothrix australiensis]
MEDRYRAAELQLGRNRSGLVKGWQIRPNWHKGRFWFAGDEGFTLVDPKAGGKRTGLTEDELVAALGARLPKHNPVESVSPDGRRVVFRDGHDLGVRVLETGEEILLTTDGTAERPYGVAPDAARYWMLLRRLGLPHPPPAVRWSPDSTKVLTHRLDNRGVPLMHLIESAPADGGRPVLHSYHYAVPGDDVLPRAEMIVFDAVTGEAVPSGGEPFPLHYTSPFVTGDAWWAEDGRAAYYLEHSRDVRTLSLRRLDPVSGEVTTLVEESGPTRVEARQVAMLPPSVRVLPQGVLWYSQRDGWGHLYLYGPTGEPVQLTSGEWAVHEVLHTDDRYVHFTANGLVEGDPYRRQVCRVALDGSGFARITQDDLDHEVSVADDGSCFLDSASTVTEPPVTTVRDWDGAVLVEVAAADVSELEASGWSAPERITVKAADGETDLYGVLHRPHGFDPESSYPVVDHVYPGPQVNRVSPAFDPGLIGYDAEALAALGFAVLALDGRGTPNRSKAFHDASYGAQAIAGHMDDHVAALRQLAETRPWLDLTRVGVCGSSGGGYAAVRAMLDHPEVFTVGVAESGSHDLRLYHPYVGDAYVGPFDEATYEHSANTTHAARLQGKLLLMHGELDDNVTPHLTMRLVNELIAADKDFDLIIVPGAEHLLLGYRHYTTRRRWDFLVRHLLGVEPPKDYQLAPIPLDTSFFTG